VLERRLKNSFFLILGFEKTTVRAHFNAQFRKSNGVNAASAKIDWNQK